MVLHGGTLTPLAWHSVVLGTWTEIVILVPMNTTDTDSDEYSRARALQGNAHGLNTIKR